MGSSSCYISSLSKFPLSSTVNSVVPPRPFTRSRMRAPAWHNGTHPLLMPQKSTFMLRILQGTRSRAPLSEPHKMIPIQSRSTAYYQGIGYTQHTILEKGGARRTALTVCNTLSVTHGYDPCSGIFCAATSVKKIYHFGWMFRISSASSASTRVPRLM